MTYDTITESWTHGGITFNLYSSSSYEFKLEASFGGKKIIRSFNHVPTSEERIAFDLEAKRMRDKITGNNIPVMRGRG